ncbi:hypothetical protein [uncultured Aquimarina sp.]|uniref:hypothetical protein n=1 Tax=uncultured Aquimarina sp. TaxID=575652 RepID=UPI0026374995|nr:hypothetical protein [uncultured Aquimarina sp.]
MKIAVIATKNQANLTVKRKFENNALFRLYQNMLIEYSSGAYAYGTLGILGQS